MITRFCCRYDKLIIDDQVYIYNDHERRIERLPFSVYSTAVTGNPPPLPPSGSPENVGRQNVGGRTVRTTGLGPNIAIAG